MLIHAFNPVQYSKLYVYFTHTYILGIHNLEKGTSRAPLDVKYALNMTGWNYDR